MKAFDWGPKSTKLFLDMGPLNHIEPTRFSGGLPVHYCYWCRVCCLLIFIGVIFLTTVTRLFLFHFHWPEHRAPRTDVPKMEVGDGEGLVWCSYLSVLFSFPCWYFQEVNQSQNSQVTSMKISSVSKTLKRICLRNISEWSSPRIFSHDLT